MYLREMKCCFLYDYFLNIDSWEHMKLYCTMSPLSLSSNCLQESDSAETNIIFTLELLISLWQ